MRSYIEALSRKVAFCPTVVLVVSVLLVILFGLGISLDITLATGVGLSVAAEDLKRGTPGVSSRPQPGTQRHIDSVA